MRDGQDGMPPRAEPVEDGDQGTHVPRVQPPGRLVQRPQHGLAPREGHLGGQPQPQRLPPRERVGPAPSGQVGQPGGRQGGAQPSQPRMVAEELRSPIQRQIQHLGDGKSLPADLQRRRLVTGASAAGTGHPGVGEQVQAHPLLADAFAPLAAATLGVGREARGAPTPGLRFGERAEQGAQLVEHPGQGRHRGTGRAGPLPSRIHGAEFVEGSLDPDRPDLEVVRPPRGAGAERGDERVEDQAALPGAGNARERDQRSQGDLQGRDGQIPTTHALHSDPAADGPDGAGGWAFPSREPAPAGRVGPDEIAGRTVEEDPPPQRTGTGAGLDDAVGPGERAQVVLHAHHGGPSVAQPGQQVVDARQVTRVEPGARLVQDVADPGERGADQGREPGTPLLALREGLPAPRKRQVTQPQVDHGPQAGTDLQQQLPARSREQGIPPRLPDRLQGAGRFQGQQPGKGASHEAEPTRLLAQPGSRAARTLSVTSSAAAGRAGPARGTPREETGTRRGSRQAGRGAARHAREPQDLGLLPLRRDLHPAGIAAQPVGDLDRFAQAGHGTLLGLEPIHRDQQARGLGSRQLLQLDGAAVGDAADESASDPGRDPSIRRGEGDLEPSAGTDLHQPPRGLLGRGRLHGFAGRRGVRRRGRGPQRRERLGDPAQGGEVAGRVGRFLSKRQRGREAAGGIEGRAGQRVGQGAAPRGQGGEPAAAGFGVQGVEGEARLPGPGDAAKRGPASGGDAEVDRPQVVGADPEEFEVGTRLRPGHPAASGPAAAGPADRRAW